MPVRWSCGNRLTHQEDTGALGPNGGGADPRPWRFTGAAWYWRRLRADESDGAGCFRPRMAERCCVAERSGAQAPEDLQLVQGPDGRVGRVGHGSPAGVSTSVISGCPDRRHQPRPWIGSAGRSPGISKASSAQTMKLREERVASVVFLDVSVALAFAAAGGGEPAPRPPLSLSLVSQPGRLPPLRWPTPRRHLSGPLCWIRPQLPDCRRRRLRRRKSHRPRRQRRARLPCRLRPPGRPPRRPRSPRRPPH